MTGSGTISDPYVIWDVADLQNVSLDLAAWYELGQNIDALATVGWNLGLGFDPLGANGNEFTGHFNGRDYTITDLTIARPLEDYVGLFGWADSASITNLIVTDATVTGDDYVGAVVGYVADSTFSEVTVITATVVGDSNVGGIAGYFYDCVVSRLTSSGTVAGDDYTGGVAGYLGKSGGLAVAPTTCSSSCIVSGGLRVGGVFGSIYADSISKSFAIGPVTADAGGGTGGLIGDCYLTNVFECCAIGPVVCTTGQGGGLLGIVDWGGAPITGSLIKNCFARGPVTASAGASVGGLCGFLTAYASVKDSFSTGAISSVAGEEGGLIGRTFPGWVGSILHSFWDINTSGKATSEGGAIGKTTAQMKNINTFLAAGWDFSQIWSMLISCNDGYPCLINVIPGCTAIRQTVRTDPVSRVI